MLNRYGVIKVGAWEKTPWWHFFSPPFRRWIECATYGHIGGDFNDSGWEYSANPEQEPAP